MVAIACLAGPKNGRKLSDKGKLGQMSGNKDSILLRIGKSLQRFNFIDRNLPWETLDRMTLIVSPSPKPHSTWGMGMGHLMGRNKTGQGKLRADSLQHLCLNFPICEVGMMPNLNVWRWLAKHTFLLIQNSQETTQRLKKKIFLAMPRRLEDMKSLVIWPLAVPARISESSLITQNHPQRIGTAPFLLEERASLKDWATPPRPCCQEEDWLLLSAWCPADGGG